MKMASIRLRRKEKVCVFCVIVVIVLTLVINKLYARKPKSARSKDTRDVKHLGYPGLLYDCATNQTDATGAVRIPDSHTLKQMNHQQLSCLYYSYLNNLQYLCRRMERLGYLEDGGWDVCIDDGYRPRKPCLVFSVGISNDFTFDDAVNQKYGCEIHSFDPSMGKKDHVHAPDMYFHATGLAAYNKDLPSGWHMRTLDFLRNQSDIGQKRRTIDILKMDIERMEWEVIPEMIKSRSYVGVKQLYIELHSLLKENGHFVYEPPRKYYLKYLKSLSLLFQAGFRIFWTHKNFTCKFMSKYGPHRTSCYEVYFVQVQPIFHSEWS